MTPETQAPGEGRPISEREAVLRERAAWVACDMEFAGKRVTRSERAASESIAARRYPLPKITRPREIVDAEHVAWRVVDGEAQWKYCASTLGWHELVKPGGSSGMFLTQERALIVSRLLANPIEEIEDDGSVSLLPGEET